MSYRLENTGRKVQRRKYSRPKCQASFKSRQRDVCCIFMVCRFSITVAAIPETDCDMESQVNLTAVEGYISSMVRWPTDCQRTTTVWSIQASPGQTINITLYDFNISSRQTGYTGKYRVCTEYGQLYDDASQHTLTICGSEQRQSHVYRSTGSVVTVQVLAEMTSPPPFFIHYEGE